MRWAFGGATFRSHEELHLAPSREIPGGEESPVGLAATAPLGIVSFLLTPQEHRRRIPATFSDFRSGDRRRLAQLLAASGKSAQHFTGGKQRAVFAGLDRAVHQPGVRRPRPLAACLRLRRGSLQQLQLSAPQCSATAGPTPAVASTLARQLPAARSSLRAAAVIAASTPQGLLAPVPAGASRPRNSHR